MTQELLERAWKEIGRFIWAFTNVEMVLDQVLIMLFSLKFPAEDLFLKSLDLRKKINIVEIALKHQSPASQEAKVLKQLHKMHDVRNNIAHKVFLPGNENGKDGISFSWSTINKKIDYEREFYSFDNFDNYYGTLREISDALMEIVRTGKPLSDDAAASSLQEIAASNVVDFPGPPSP